jgi:hypothetical protein
MPLWQSVQGYLLEAGAKVSFTLLTPSSISSGENLISEQWMIFGLAPFYKVVPADASPASKLVWMMDLLDSAHSVELRSGQIERRFFSTFS